MFKRLFFRKSIVPSLLAMTGFMAFDNFNNKKYECCGIFGVISGKNRA
jgi:hypothetical protein